MLQRGQTSRSHLISTMPSGQPDLPQADKASASGVSAKLPRVRRPRKLRRDGSHIAQLVFSVSEMSPISAE